MLEKLKPRQSIRKKGLLAKLHKMQNRIQQKITNGSFSELTKRKQRQLILRLRRYTIQLNRLGLSLKTGAAIGVLSLAMSIINPVASQVNFEERTGMDNPLDQVDQGLFPYLSFVDIDNDGDQDLFMGIYDEVYETGRILYFKNEGSATEPDLVLQDMSNNPVGDQLFTYIALPTFVDIDDDGDQDLFVGLYGGSVSYYENVGTPTEPAFTQLSGDNNPLDLVSQQYVALPTFADIDGDGDQDAFIGEYYGTVSYYKNEGSDTDPNFTFQGGMNNPLDLVNAEYISAPDLVDVDQDGDFDAFVGAESGTVFYFENIGDDMSPDFEEQTGMDNPLDGEQFQYYTFPAFVDIDGDGDQDVFIGELYGGIYFYENAIGTSLVTPNNVCLNAPVQDGLGGGLPEGGVYSGLGVIDDGNGMTYSFDPSTAGVGIHTISYNVGDGQSDVSIEVYPIPTVTIDLPDTLFIENGMLPMGIDGGGLPVGGTYASGIGDEIDDDGNGMTFSFNELATAGTTYSITYTFTDQNGCQNTVFKDVVLGADPLSIEYLGASTLEIYPNPTAGVLELKGFVAEEITVMDVHGKLLKKQLNPGSRLDISDLPGGVYFLKIMINEKLVSTKIIKR